MTVAAPLKPCFRGAVFSGSMSIVGVEQKEEPKKRSSVERHITPFFRRHEAQ